jgi:hypothetical protein
VEGSAAVLVSSAQQQRDLVLAQFNTDPQTMADDLAAFQSASPWQIYISQPSKGMSSEKYDSNVIRLANMYRAPSYDVVQGPVSNSAAAFPIIQLGGTQPWRYDILHLYHWMVHPYGANLPKLQ